MDINAEIKQVCLGILLEVDRICNMNNIRYYIYSGTLLGAVRHKGFIPWDDDIDIVMFREDYNNFVQACQKDLDRENYILQTIDSDPMTNNPWIKLHKKDTAFVSGVRRKGSMEGINIDIFPIDNAPDSRFIRRIRGQLIDKLNWIYEFRFSRKDKNSSKKMKIFRTVIACIPPFDEMKYKKKYDKYIQRYNKKKTEYVVYLSNGKYADKTVKREWLRDVVYMDFEGYSFPAPIEWKKVLEVRYGSDYMTPPPVEKRVTQHGTIAIDLNKSWEQYQIE